MHTNRLRKIIGIASLVLMLGAGGFFLVLPRLLDRYLNRVEQGAGPPPSSEAVELYRRLFVADLHADSLLWGRDLSRRHSVGQIDLPRLIEGNVALQAFTVVTKVPRGLNIERNKADSDLITLLALAERWPPRSWGDLTERALYQAERFHHLVSGSSGRLVAIRTRADLESYRTRRAQEQSIAAGWLGIEGAHALEGNIDNVVRLFDAGFRMMSPTHFFDNRVGGSAHGVEKGGLTEFGRRVVKRMESLGMLVDLAHASPKVVDDVVAMATRPVVVSHTGARATCDNVRNLTDRQIRDIAATGGIIGIGYWETAVCGRDARAIARAIHHVAELVGARHVALGSDFDGAVTTPFDSTGLARLVDALLEEGINAPEIRLIMGENVVRLLLETLPSRPALPSLPSKP